VFSSEVGSGSRQENASKQKTRTDKALPVTQLRNIHFDNAAL
jgi:hypothetical protein